MINLTRISLSLYAQYNLNYYYYYYITKPNFKLSTNFNFKIFIKLKAIREF